MHVAKEKGDSNKIKDLQAQVARLKEKLLEQQEVAERTKPFDENIVFRSEVRHVRAHLNPYQMIPISREDSFPPLTIYSLYNLRALILASGSWR